jgi:hypothetical protein
VGNTPGTWSILKIGITGCSGGGAQSAMIAAASLAPRKLLLAKVVDASGRIVDVDSIARDLNLIRKSYGQQNSIESLLIRDGENTRNFLMEWLK